MAEDVLSEGRFVTIYNGAGFAPCSVECLERHVKKSDLRILCCGNLYGRKDIPLLVKAFANIADEFPDTQLRSAGDGPDRQHIESLIQSLPCRHRIQLLGSIEHSAVQQEMLAADVFALVGWAEPFGVVFLEAMANGCPVVVCDDAGVAEILTDRTDALLTKPHDVDSVVIALRDLCSSARLRRAIATAGHALYQQSCQWHHRAAEYRDVLQMAIDESPLLVKADR
jgi:glycosyltransferase involved in cell wall biosynthesis